MAVLGRLQQVGARMESRRYLFYSNDFMITRGCNPTSAVLHACQCWLARKLQELRGLNLGLPTTSAEEHFGETSLPAVPYFRLTGEKLLA